MRSDIENRNLILGTLDLGLFDDLFTNIGVWNTAGGFNDFGDGTDLVVNTGTVIAAQDAELPEITTLARLDLFRNLPNGMIRMDDGGTLDRTILGGNYAGEGGILLLDTFLDIDSAPSDVFVIDGATSGQTDVFVYNTGGPGALTTGFGILIVDVGEPENSTGEFLLANGDYVIARTGETAVRAGAFGYALRQETDGDWYLQSEWQPATPIYEVYPSVLLGMIGSSLPRLQERVGNRHWAQPAQVAEASYVMPEPVYVFCKDPAQNFRCMVTPEQAQVYAQTNVVAAPAAAGAVIQGHGLWLRTDGALTRYQPTEATVGASYRSRMAGVQIGYDHVLVERENGGRLIGGLNLNYRMARADVSTALSRGKISTTGYGIGGSLTWYEPNGFYMDAQAQAMWLTSDLSADGLGVFADGHKAMGYGLSLEIGKEIALSDTWAITPQAQLSYANVKESGFTDAFGTQVSFNAESLQLRLGVEVSHEKSWEAEDGTTSRRSLRAGAHVIHEFKPETEVVVSGTPLRSRGSATMGEITLGGTYNWRDDRNSVYGQIAASTGINNFGDSYRIRGTVGYRRQWE